MAATHPPLPAVVIDTREQLPYGFGSCAVVRRALPAGDYSIDGCEHSVAVERKSQADAYGSVGRGRRRFEREFARLAEYSYAAVVIEATLEEFLTAPAHSAVHPRQALHTLLGWSVKYGVHVHFAGSRRFASALTLHLLRHWWRYNSNKKPHGGRFVSTCGEAYSGTTHEKTTRIRSIPQANSV